MQSKAAECCLEAKEQTQLKRKYVKQSDQSLETGNLEKKNHASCPDEIWCGGTTERKTEINNRRQVKKDEIGF